MELRAYEVKFIQVFLKLSEPGYVLNNYYAENLLGHLADRGDKDGRMICQSSFMVDLLIDLIHNIKSSTSSVKNFIINLTSVIAKSELQFSKIQYSGALCELLKFIDVHNPHMQPSTKVAYVSLLTALTQHSSGMTWLMTTDCWRKVFAFNTNKQTIYVKRAVTNFLSTLLWKLSDNVDEANSFKILEVIMKPIIEHTPLEMRTVTDEDEDRLFNMIYPTLQLIIELMETPNKLSRPNILMRLLSNHFCLEFHIMVIYDTTRNKDLLLCIAKIAFLSNYSKVHQNKNNGEAMTQNELLEVSLLNSNLVIPLIKKRYTDVILDFAVACNLYWAKYCQNLPQTFTINGKEFNVPNQLIVVLLMPIYSLLSKPENGTDCISDKLEQFNTKIFDLSCEHTTRISYLFSALVLEDNTRAVAARSINRLFTLKKHLTNTQAGLIYQSLHHMLFDMLPKDEINNLALCCNVLETVDDRTVVSGALDAIHMLIKGYDISWQESVEVLCLLNVCINLLKFNNVPTKIVTQTLNLMKLAIEKFLQPNLALLMDTKDEESTTLSEIGPIVYAKLHDCNWEVRDSAMEILLVMTELAFIKYPPFHKVILNSQLTSLAATISLNDSESYVRATALRCLAAAAKIKILWNECLKEHPNIINNMLSLLSNNPEGIVRKEAAPILTQIFESQKISSNVLPDVYTVMYKAAVEDLHWEVQLASLNFWRKVIQQHLSEQGMLDGVFPTMTFSKVERKIVRLNEPEIQKRLIKASHELAANGCLRVLVSTLTPETDCEVMECSFIVAKQLTDILAKYNVHTLPAIEKTSSVDIEQPSSLKLNTSVNSNGNATTTIEDKDVKNEVEKSDTIIESILETDDINLLANIYETHLNVKQDEDDEFKPSVTIGKEQYVAPSDFLSQMRSVDYQKMINDKVKWNSGLKSLHSLLDDIICVYDSPNVNDMDCY